MSWFVTMLFGCAHRHRTFPMTAMKPGPNCFYARTPTTTYVVCLDCGKEFPYDWEQMKLVGSAKHKQDAVA
jgi:hypothetical protein